MISRLSVERGLTEHQYLHRYPFRIVVIHAGAWLRDKTLAVAALAGSGDGDGVRASADDLWQDTVVDEKGNTLENLRGGAPRPKTSADARRTAAKLPHWYDRSRARRHVVSHLEDHADRLLMMSWKLSGKEGMFRPTKKGLSKPIESYKELDMLRAVKKIAGGLDEARRGQALGW